MNVATFSYERFLRSHRRTKPFWSLLRQALIQVLHDPACVMKVHGQRLEMPLSHALPLYLKANPYYDRLPARLGSYLRREYGALTCVDVGANIGDSVAAFAPVADDRFLAIEPNPRYYAYLQHNWGKSSTVKTLNMLCSSSSGTGVYAIQETVGTASIVKTDKGAPLQSATLDDILRQNPEFSALNLLKIDTDGHDFEVIDGAKTSIQQNMPAIFFECDAFTNMAYIDDCLNALSFFRDCGYESFLVYDNYGYLMGKYSLNDLPRFRDLLFYQLTKTYFYYDILLMKEEHALSFFSEEQAFFAGRTAGVTQKALLSRISLMPQD
jgi:FkbM family methyltransferase